MSAKNRVFPQMLSLSFLSFACFESFILRCRSNAVIVRPWMSTRVNNLLESFHDSFGLFGFASFGYLFPSNSSGARHPAGTARGQIPDDRRSGPRVFLEWSIFLDYHLDFNGVANFSVTFVTMAAINGDNLLDLCSSCLCIHYIECVLKVNTRVLKTAGSHTAYVMKAVESFAFFIFKAK